LAINPVIEVLRELIRIHEAFIVTAKEKTKIVKSGNTETLQQVLVKERKYMQQLEQAEARRQKAVEIWFSGSTITPGEKTLTHMLDSMENETEKRELERQTVTLTKAITMLKQQEQLNQALIRQSLQFVHLSLDMLNPAMKNINYGKSRQSDGIKRSVFDSRA
jgi:flagellar biosynthesis/type III secretory pathway chaperone